MNRITEDIKTGQFKRAYVLHGSERYLLRKYLKELLNALNAAEDNINFNYFSRFEGRAPSESDIIDACETLPIFDERRVVLLEDAGIFKGKSERLIDYFTDIPEYLVLIFSEDEIDKRGKLYKTLAKYGGAIEFKELSERDIMNHVFATLKENGKKMERRAVDMFCVGCGTDLGFASCELEKLISYSGSREEITVEDIQKLCSPRLENRIFDMISNMAAGRRGKALELYNELILLKEAPMKILALIERQFRQLLDIRELLERGMGQEAIAGALGVHPYSVKKNIPLARGYSQKEIRDILEETVQIDEDIKSGRINDRIAVELVLMRERHKRERA